MRFRALRPPTPARSVALAVLGPGAAIGLGLVIDRRSVIGATSLFLLAVVAAAAFGGHRSGFAASVIGFLSLNFFFTPPYHTFAVRHRGDLIALLVFLAVSVIVGTLLARAIEERGRAERRVAEARFLDRITAKLIGGEPTEQVLADMARDLLEMFELARCEIHLSGHPAVVTSRSNATPDGPRLEVPLAAATALGTLTAVRREGAPSFAGAERAFLQALAAQAALALERAALDAEVHSVRLDAEANRTRAALFSSVTHDLRTPLASIKAGATGLLDDVASYDDEQRAEVLRTIVEEADRLNRIVANLLDLARMRSGALTPARQPVWIQDIVNAVLTRMRSRLRGFDVRVNVRPDVPAVDADPMQLDQVLTNVLENAARFAPARSEIAISAARWHGAVQVRIADHGPGIDLAERDRVFEEFY
ncbi:MAG: DUF4118 domain-containing protein, partial [Actinomycetota bacterium]